MQSRQFFNLSKQFKQIDMEVVCHDPQNMSISLPDDVLEIVHGFILKDFKISEWKVSLLNHSFHALVQQTLNQIYRMNNYHLVNFINYYNIYFKINKKIKNYINKSYLDHCIDQIINE